MKQNLKLQSRGMSLIETLIVIVLLSISFVFFLKGLSTSRMVRITSELHTVQAVLLNNLEQEIRARRFDENTTAPWSATLGLDTGSHLLSFDGINDQILIGDINALDSPSDFTVSFWFKRNSDLAANSNHSTSNVMYAKASDPANDNIEIGTDGTFIELYIHSQGYDGTQNYDAGIQNNTWYHFALTYSSNATQEASLYINGSNIISWDNWGGNLVSASSSPVTIGNTNHIETPYNGYINEVAVWNEALTATEIMTIYNSGSGFNAAENSGNYSSASGLIGYWKINEGTGTIANDGSGNNTSGSLENGPSWESSGVTENSITSWDDIDDFDGYSVSSMEKHPTFSCSVAVKYVDVSSGFHTAQTSPTNYKSVMVKISHPTISTMTDTMIISQGL